MPSRIKIGVLGAFLIAGTVLAGCSSGSESSQLSSNAPTVTATSSTSTAAEPRWSKTQAMFAEYWPAAYAKAPYLETMCKKWAKGNMSADDAWGDFQLQVSTTAYDAGDYETAQFFAENGANPSPKLLQEMSEFLDYECGA